MSLTQAWATPKEFELISPLGGAEGLSGENPAARLQGSCGREESGLQPLRRGESLSSYSRLTQTLTTLVIRPGQRGRARSDLEILGLSLEMPGSELLALFYLTLKNRADSQE